MRPVEDFVATAAVRPETLNPNSTGGYLTVYIELEEDMAASLIDPNTVGVIVDGRSIIFAEPGSSSISDFDDNGVEDLAVKIDRQRVLDSVEPGSVEITVVGRAVGRFFQEADTITVMPESRDLPQFHED